MRLAGRLVYPWIVAVALGGCSERVHYLGYNAEASSSPSSGAVSVSAGDAAAPVSASDAGSSTGGDGGVEPDTESLDTGDAGDASDAGSNVGEPRNPPNVLVDDLGLDPATVTTRLNALYNRLFVTGNADSELIYFERGDDEAFVLDVLHDDARMDAMGYGLLLTVQFDDRERFARLWTNVETHFRYAEGPRSGFFRFSCTKDFTECSDTIDSFGSYYAITALLMAADRWGETAYRDAADAAMAATRNKESNGLATEGVVNLFSDEGVPRRSSLVEQMGTVSPVSLLPAFFEYWHYRTGDAFWRTVADRSRRLLIESPHPETGLTPDLLTEAGQAAESPAVYEEESYPSAFHMALDAAWFNHRNGVPVEYVEQVNRLLGFFARQTPSYSALYYTDGTIVEDKVSAALIVLNGTAASIATLEQRNAFLRQAWDTTATGGIFRFYDGVYQLLSLMFLGGDLKVTF